MKKLKLFKFNSLKLIFSPRCGATLTGLPTKLKFNWFFVGLSLILSALNLISCNNKITASKFYIVQSGDTLYSIAKQHKINLQQLAATNKLHAPYTIHKGRRLILLHNPAKTSISSLPKNSKKINKINQNSHLKVHEKLAVMQADKISWNWPAKGKIIKNFIAAGPDKGNGIDIAGSLGTQILAAANGRVVYAGNNLRGYGNLIIIKHDQDFLSAYAHNDQILVLEQQKVTKGQKIATMGSTDSKNVKLHFEIRYKGKPVDPIKIFKESMK